MNFSEDMLRDLDKTINRLRELGNSRSKDKDKLLER
jgi:hypothetical protein